VRPRLVGRGRAQDGTSSVFAGPSNTREVVVASCTRDVLELAKHAKSLLETRSREEKRDFLARLACNPRLNGRTVRFDLRRLFAVIAKMRVANDWRPQGESKNVHLAVKTPWIVTNRGLVRNGWRRFATTWG